MLTNNIFFNEIIKSLIHNTYVSRIKNTTYTTYLTDVLDNKFNYSNKHSFNTYLTSIELINYKYLIKKFNLKYKYSMITYFASFLIKNGKKLYILNNSLKAVSNIYNTINYGDISQLSSYNFVEQFKHYISVTNNAYNINHLITWIINIYRPVFDIRCYNTPKIYKKKNKKKTFFKVVYLSDKERLKTAYKHIATYIKKDQENKLEKRISNVFLDLILNYKKSYLYERKIFIYEQATKL